MSDALVWHLLATAFTCFVAFAALTAVWSFHPLINGTGAFQAALVWPAWMLTFLMVGVTITSDTAFYDVVWFYGIPWPYLVGFILLFIPPLNTIGVAGSACVITVAIWVIKLFWVYS